MLSFIVQFDRRIEARGLEGQFETAPAHPSTCSPGGHESATCGPVFEETGGPGIALELAGGDVITMDSRRLARQTAGGSFRWSRHRPGRHPAALMAIGNLLLFSGPGPEFEDDSVIAAVDLDRGTKLWSYHFLGRRVLPAAAGDGAITLSAMRPSGSTIRLLALCPPALLWVKQLDEGDGTDQGE